MKNDLMRIGEIAEFFGVSRKAIRLYEKKGIIKPVEVDAQNGYRYYSAAQVQQLNALLELKTLGFSLEEIKSVLDGETTKERLLDALAKKR
ncbi:MAG: MerR family transcriptional regulator [bacterium]|nr:MerR family transcriptional regulator [bacterium]MCM1233228.1 MerR family transcriptional regulator [Ruminococcus flavefaciens]